MPPVGIGISVGWITVHDAAKNDDLQSLIDSIEAKKGMPIRDVDMRSATGYTPLHVAAMHGSNLCIPYLVSMKADLTIQDSKGRLAMHYAAEAGQIESIMHLAACGQDINAQDNEGNTPIHLAACGQSKMCQYLIEIGANLSIKNNRGWTPLQAATVPMFRISQEIMETSITSVNRIRREYDPVELRMLLLDCGLERFEPLFIKAGYGASRLLQSCKPISLNVLNDQAEKKVDMMNLREYLFFLENLQRYHCVEKRNPFADNAHRMKYWDEHPDEFEQYMKDNPDFDPSKVDDSMWRRPVFEKEREFMDFMHEVLDELKNANKEGIFSNMLTVTGLPVEGADGRVYVDSSLIFEGITSIVDSGWPDVQVMDFEQIARNINDGMYQLWDQFVLDYMMMLCNVCVYCRAVKSDMEPAFRAAVAMMSKGVKVLRKHRTSLIKKQAAKDAERAEIRAKNR